MRSKTYKIMANETAADVVADNDITLETGLTLDEAWRASIEFQKAGGHVAVWIEEEKAPRKPRITRSVEGNHNKTTCVVVRCDGWMV